MFSGLFGFFSQKEGLIASKVIGLQIIDLEGSFSRMVWLGVSQMAKAHDHILVLYPGHNPNNPILEYRQKNAIYNFLTPSVIDAVIIQPSTLRNFISEKQFDIYLKKMTNDLPLVSLDENIRNIPSFQTDNISGVKEGVRHLFLEHDCRKIGFLKGPEQNFEAKQRLQAFKEAIRELGLPSKPEWIFPGDFMEDSGEKWVEEYGTNPPVDALFCANDNMALGVLSALNRKGLPVPETIRIFGFDDKDESRFQQIPLTTVHQPLQRMGLEAFQTALDLLDGKSCQPLKIFETELRLRESCGCSSSTQKHIQMTRYADVINRSSVLEDFIRNELSRFLMEDEIKRIREWTYRLMGVLMEKLPTEVSVQKLLKNIDEFITHEMFNRGTQLDWQNLFSMIYMTSKKLSPNHILYSHFDFFQKARIIVGEKNELFRGIERNSYYRYQDDHYRAFSSDVMTCRSVRGILDVLEKYLPLFKIYDFHLVLYRIGPLATGLFSEIPETSRLVFSYESGSVKYSDSNGLVFPTLDFLPMGWRPASPGVFAIMPLFFTDKSLGYYVSQISEIDSRANTDLQVFLSLAFYQQLNP